MPLFGRVKHDLTGIFWDCFIKEGIYIAFKKILGEISLLPLLATGHPRRYAFSLL
jgi:hypothetical protein